MTRLSRGEDLYQLRNYGAREGAASYDGRELPPQGAIAKIGNEEVRHYVSQRDRDQRSQPNKACQRSFEIHFGRGGISRFRNSLVYKIRKAACDDHHDAHHEDPYQQLYL